MLIQDNQYVSLVRPCDKIAGKEVTIETTVKKADALGGDGSNYIKLESTEHLASNIEGENIVINSTGTTTIRGSNVHADKNLSITAKAIDIVAVNDSSYRESKLSSKGFLSKSETTSKKATSTNIASNVSGGNVTLSTINNLDSTAAGGDINIIGSNLSAKETLALNSAGNINVQAGFDGTLDETHSKKSGWFTGGALFSKSEDLEGKLTKTAALANLSGGNVSLNANKDIALVGVNVAAEDSLTGRAQNITVENVNNEEKTYSKHTKLTVSVGAALKNLTQPQKMVKYKDGKLSATLAKAEYSKADKVTTRTEVVASNLDAGNINLTTGATDKVNGEAREGALGYAGNITVKGSNLTAKSDVNLTASGDVTIIEAKNTEKNASKEVKGKAELKVTVKNEYVQIAFAVKAAKDAKDNLKKSKSDYSQYKRYLGKQRGKLIKLKADLANGRIGIEQADVDEMASLIDDLKSDAAFYKANIALAAADLATKIIAVVSQMSTAASASWAYGFSASLELDVDVLEKKFEAYKEQSVASNITANNINITANNMATIRGSNLNANNEININANDTNILASQDVNNSSNSSEHKNLNISYGTAGGGSASASMDRSKGSSRDITNQNSRLVASNIHINTQETTSINGANISASDKLNINTKNLDVASVQDSQNSRSQSSGFSVSGGMDGISGAGINAGNSRSREKLTVQTTLNGNAVNIATQERTTLRGAMIAAVDQNGQDNGNLNIKTNTLEVSSLNNRRDSKSMSLGVNAGISNQKQRDKSSSKSSLSTVGIDYSNDRSNSKTKTLGTIGEGNIEVASVGKSNTRMLNRDIKDNEINIYDIQGHQGLKGTIDTRVFTKKGRAEIKKEFKEFGKNMQIVAKGLPEANNSNAILALIGKGLDKISSATGGIIPSNGANGGLLGNIPVIMGDKDINHKLIQVASADSKYVKANPDLFIAMEESDYFKTANPKNKEALKGKGLFVSKEPISIDVANATYQNFTNGMLNTIGDAMKNAMDQTSSDEEGAAVVFTVNYNPTHGLIGDGLESAVDKAGGTTGIAKQTGEFINSVTTARGKRGSHFAAHSQGNLLTKQGIEYRKEHGGFKDRTYFINPNAPVDKQNEGVPTFAGYGSPVNTKDMGGTLKAAGFKNLGMVTHPDDFVGEGLGGNKGKDKQMDVKGRLNSVVDVPKLFTDESPHSTYKCSENKNVICGDRP